MVENEKEEKCGFPTVYLLLCAVDNFLLYMDCYYVIDYYESRCIVVSADY